VVAADIQTSWTPPQVPGQGNPTTPVATAPREQDAVSAWLDEQWQQQVTGFNNVAWMFQWGAGKLFTSDPKGELAHLIYEKMGPGQRPAAHRPGTPRPQLRSGAHRCARRDGRPQLPHDVGDGDGLEHEQPARQLLGSAWRRPACRPDGNWPAPGTAAHRTQRPRRTDSSLCLAISGQCLGGRANDPLTPTASSWRRQFAAAPASTASGASTTRCRWARR